MTPSQQPWLIVGQGLAGSCLAWEFFHRSIPFEIVDNGSGGSSRVAAGMVNPITGKNFQPSWRIKEFHPQAVSFYTDLELKLDASFWHPLPVLRLASSEKEWKKIEGKFDKLEVIPWLQSSNIPTPPGFAGAVELKGGGRLDTFAFMEATRRFFTNYGIHRISHHDTSQPHTNRILAVICYPGHPEGAEESKAVESFFHSLPNHRIARYSLVATKGSAPFLLLARNGRKLSAEKLP